MAKEHTRKHGLRADRLLSKTRIPVSADPVSAVSRSPANTKAAQPEASHTDGRPSTFDALLSDFDLERLTGCKRSTWQKKRLLGGNETPPFIRIGRLVRYRQSEFEAWLAAIPSRRSTSEAAA
jgi:predicted DNA-binding transcriptional regulator AlpA